jgi:hypothetical protein
MMNRPIAFRKFGGALRTQVPEMKKRVDQNVALRKTVREISLSLGGELTLDSLQIDTADSAVAYRLAKSILESFVRGKVPESP